MMSQMYVIKVLRHVYRAGSMFSPRSTIRMNREIFLTIPLYPGDVEGLQHQRENQPDGNPRPATHASLLEG